MVTKVNLPCMLDFSDADAATSFCSMMREVIPKIKTEPCEGKWIFFTRKDKKYRELTGTEDPMPSTESTNGQCLTSEISCCCENK